jgi:hypothetical protein
MRLVLGISRTVVAIAFVAIVSSHAFAADGGSWSVSKSSGEVWIATSDVQQASLKQDDSLKPGDMVRTGRTGRVLLTRGQETIMIAPNSVVGIPAEAKEGLSTTIVQQAGSILLEAEKRNVKHFAVETPYLAAVVKGTQFRVTVNAAATSVDVIRGQVEVRRFQIRPDRPVMPGQQATSFAQGKVGLSLSGSGTLNPIEQGKPRAPRLTESGAEERPVGAAQRLEWTNDPRPWGRRRHAKLGPNPQRNVGADGKARRDADLVLAWRGAAEFPQGDERPCSRRVRVGSSRSAANKDTVWGSSAPARRRPCRAATRTVPTAVAARARLSPRLPAPETAATAMAAVTGTAAETATAPTANRQWKRQRWPTAMERQWQWQRQCLRPRKNNQHRAAG